MRRLFGVVFAIAVCALLVGAAVSTVNAQTDPKDPVPVLPPLCEDISRVDLNGDGTFNGDDFEFWVYTVHFSGACELDGPINEQPRCPQVIDVNRDGIVSALDLEAMVKFLEECINAPWRTRTG